MNFIEALKELKQGNVIRRKESTRTFQIKTLLCSDRIVNNSDVNVLFSRNDIDADDWEIKV